MHIANPFYFVLSFFIAAFILFYFFRKQYETTTIPSNLLWEQVLNEWQASPWLHKLQNNLLFWLQLLVLLLLMLSLVRPFWFQKGISGDHLVLIIDTSASMSAKEGDFTRFDQAKQEMAKILKMVEDQEVTIICADQKPLLLANHETNQSELQKKTKELELTYSHENIDQALKLADSLSKGKKSVIHLYSDSVGKNDISGVSEEIPVHVHNYNRLTDNLSLRSFGTANTDGVISGVSVIENQTSRDEEVIFRVSNGQEILFSKKINVKASGEKTVHIPVLKEKPYYTASIEVQDDYSADNEMTYIQTPVYEKVYAVGDVNPFLINGLETIGLDIIQLDDKEKVGKDGIVMAEGVELKELGSYPLLFVNAEKKGNQKLTGERKGNSDPLMDFVEMDHVYIESASPPVNKQWDSVWMSGEDPLIQKGTYHGQPIIALNFSIAATDWPLQPGFPIFLYNSYQWLTQQTDFLGYFQPGEEKWLNLGIEEGDMSIFTESGKNLYSVDIQKEGFRAPNKPGTYEAIAGEQVFSFSVLLDDREKKMDVAPSFNMNRTSSASKDEGSEMKQDNLWYPLSCLALLFLMVEWEVYRRGH